MRTFRSILLVLLLVLTLALGSTSFSAEKGPGSSFSEGYLLELLNILMEKYGHTLQKLEATSTFGAIAFPSQFAITTTPDGKIINSRSFANSVALTTPSVFGPIPTSNYFLLSFWYNSTIQSAHTVMFRAEDPGGSTVAELAFENEDMLLTLQVDNQGAHTTVAFSSKGVAKPGTLGETPVIQYDGQWHNVIVNAHMTGGCLTDDTLPCCVNAEFQIDNGGGQGGAAQSLLAIDSTGQTAGTTISSFGPFVWSNATSWTIGGVKSIPAGLIPALGIGAYDPFFRGMMAEFYLQLDDGGVDPPAPLITSIGQAGGVVGRLIKRGALQAVSLGQVPHTCLGPTGRAPTMCHAGSPAYFLTGVVGSYQLTPVGGDIRFATSDPCDPTQKLFNGVGCR